MAGGVAAQHNDDALVVEIDRICDGMATEALKGVTYTDGGERSVTPVSTPHIRQALKGGRTPISACHAMPPSVALSGLTCLFLIPGAALRLPPSMYSRPFGAITSLCEVVTRDGIKGLRPKWDFGLK